MTTLFGKRRLLDFSEYVSGFGEAKFAYDAATYFGAFIGCEAGLF